MKLHTLTKAFAACIVAVSAVAQLSADVIETKSGSRITGKVVKIDGSSVVVNTDFAGDIKVKQSEVVSISTEAPLNIRLAGGTVLQGTLSSPTGGGAVVLTGSEGTINTSVEKIATTWAPGTIDPELAALQRGWAYEVAVDVTGKTGNKEQLGTSFSARAVQKNAQDTLQFYTAYDRQETDGLKSADQFKAGVDYANNFAGRLSWYTRDEGGFDRVKDIELYNIAAAGLGYDFIKKANQTLTGRAGVSFRYEGYKNPLIEDVKAAGLDFGLTHEYTGSFWSLVNRISWVPLFEDFGNYRAQHESYLELPMANPKWKARFGVSNDFNSEPAPGVDKLDTTYFARLVLSFK
ncbi:hypothetical protein CMV30_08145 [Nibricoccus aquaticus]|uniref:DUF481 domain-containing protein n=1 Tax=Nibricoccus aquaticus TaxID=2576891 RepID=A0A290Q612_9BACT|nr:DUF481 domain-containing protein [Nibricoccus aquaticus]ATC63924.1 hypothetical protein CMV30_08145 [Nibricoccus aquaticus]